VRNAVFKGAGSYSLHQILKLLLLIEENSRKVVKFLGSVRVKF
jgi:hypothetical protein